MLPCLIAVNTQMVNNLYNLDNESMPTKPKENFDILKNYSKIISQDENQYEDELYLKKLFANFPYSIKSTKSKWNLNNKKLIPLNSTYSNAIYTNKTEVTTSMKSEKKRKNFSFGGTLTINRKDISFLNQHDNLNKNNNSKNVTVYFYTVTFL